MLNLCVSLHFPLIIPSAIDFCCHATSFQTTIASRSLNQSFNYPLYACKAHSFAAKNAAHLPTEQRAHSKVSRSSICIKRSLPLLFFCNAAPHFHLRSTFTSLRMNSAKFRCCCCSWSQATPESIARVLARLVCTTRGTRTRHAAAFDFLFRGEESIFNSSSFSPSPYQCGGQGRCFLNKRLPSCLLSSKNPFEEDAMSRELSRSFAPLRHIHTNIHTYVHIRSCFCNADQLRCQAGQTKLEVSELVVC